MARAPSEAPTCTPAEVMAAYPCLKCASPTQLMGFLAITLYALNHGGDYTVEDMVEDAKCWKCLSDQQLLQSIVATMIALAVANGYFDDAQAVIDAANCLICGTEPKTLKAIIAKANCDLVQLQWPGPT